MPAGIEPRLVGRPALLDPRDRQARRQDRDAEPAAFAERRRRDHAAPERQVGALHRAGPQLRHLNLEILAIVVTGPPPYRGPMMSTASSMRSRLSSLRSPCPTNSYSL